MKSASFVTRRDLCLLVPVLILGHVGLAACEIESDERLAPDEPSGSNLIGTWVATDGIPEGYLDTPFKIFFHELQFFDDGTLSFRYQMRGSGGRVDWAVGDYRMVDGRSLRLDHSGGLMSSLFTIDIEGDILVASDPDGNVILYRREG